MSDYLEYFDFDAFPSSDEYTFDFGALDNLPLVGEEGQNPASNAGLSLPGVTAPIVEPVRASLPDLALIGSSAIFPATLTPNLQLAQITSIEVPASLETGTPVRITPSGYDRPTPASGECHILEGETTESHQHDPDIPDHRQIQGLVPFSCAECRAPFSSQSKLEFHGYHSRHRTHACSCGKSFARLYSLLRHQRRFLKNGRLLPCTFCKRHRGEDGFRRRDHFIQHLTIYHKFSSDKIQRILPSEKHVSTESYWCIEPTCEFHRGEEFEGLELSPFQRCAEYNKHLKEAHNVTSYPCPIAECTRVGAKGYTTWNGLQKHLALKHKTSPGNLGLEIWDNERSCDQCQKELPHLETFNIHHQLLHQS